MNILIFNYDALPQYIGGIKRVAITLAKQWELMGHCVYFLCASSAKDCPSELEGVRQYILPELRELNSEENKEYAFDIIINQEIDILLNPFADNADIVGFIACLRDKIRNILFVSAYHFSPTHEIDVVSRSFFPKFWFGNRMVKYLIDALFWLRFTLFKKKKIKRFLQGHFSFVQQNSDAIVLLSSRYIKDVAEMIGRSECLYAIHNPLHLENNENPADLLQKKKIVLWCGRVGYGAKRIDRMMSIWKRVSVKYPDWRCCVLGSGDIKTFSDMAKEYNIPRIEFIGFCNPFEWYKRASILCMTSSTEGWPMVLLESQSFACVPMTYDSYGAATEIIEDGKNGLLVEAFDEDDFVNKLISLIEDKEKRNRMAEACVRSVVKYDVEKVSEQWVNLFTQLHRK